MLSLRLPADVDSVGDLVAGMKDNILALCEAAQNFHFCFVPVADLDISQFCAAILDHKRAPSLAPARRLKQRFGPQPNPFILPLHFDSGGSSMLAVEAKG